MCGDRGRRRRARAAARTSGAADVGVPQIRTGVLCEGRLKTRSRRAMLALSMLTTSWLVDWSTVGPAQPPRCSAPPALHPAARCHTLKVDRPTARRTAASRRATSEAAGSAAGAALPATARAATPPTAARTARSRRASRSARRCRATASSSSARRRCSTATFRRRGAARHRRRRDLAPAGQLARDEDRQPLLRAVRPDAAGLRPARHRLRPRGRGDAERGAGAVRLDAALHPRLLDGRVLLVVLCAVPPSRPRAPRSRRGASPAAD